MVLETLYEKLAQNPHRRARFITLDGRLVEKTFAEMHADVLELMAELRAGGLRAGDLVGVLGPNTYEWALADIALLGLRCVVVAVPVEGRLTPDDVGAAVERYRLKAALVTRALGPDAELPPGVSVLESRPLALRPVDREAGDRPPLAPEVVTIVFSSGTAGTMKGLPLTDQGILNTIRVSMQAWEVTGDDDILIVMPFSSFQQRYLLYLAIWAGCDASVVVPERMFLMLKRLNPTVVLGPPSFFEIVHHRVMSAPGQWPYRIASALHRVPFTRPLRARLGREWLGMYGTRVRLMLTGSAPVPPRMLTVFQRFGAPLYEIYGSTETGWIACNTRRHHRIGAAGRPVPGVTVELGDDGEVLLRVEHPQAHGYVYEGVENQATVFRPDGRIATGDVGTVDRAGFLRLTGRKKNVIITRSGVKINPEPLEAGLERACPGATAVVVSPAGDGVLTCVVWLSEALGEEAVSRYVEEANRRGPASHRVAATVFRPTAELTVESGLLTRNLKINRTAVLRSVFATTGGGRDE